MYFAFGCVWFLSISVCVCRIRFCILYLGLYNGLGYFVFLLVYFVFRESILYFVMYFIIGYFFTSVCISIELVFQMVHAMQV